MSPSPEEVLKLPWSRSEPSQPVRYEEVNRNGEGEHRDQAEPSPRGVRRGRLKKRRGSERGGSTIRSERPAWLKWSRLLPLGKTLAASWNESRPHGREEQTGELHSLQYEKAEKDRRAGRNGSSNEIRETIAGWCQDAGVAIVRDGEGSAAGMQPRVGAAGGGGSADRTSPERPEPEVAATSNSVAEKAGYRQISPGTSDASPLRALADGADSESAVRRGQQLSCSSCRAVPTPSDRDETQQLRSGRPPQRRRAPSR